MTCFAAQRVQTRLQPPAGPDTTFRAQAAIYRQGKTPVTDTAGRLSAWDKRPAGPKLTGHQLGEVHNRFGNEGLGRSLHAGQGTSYTPIITGKVAYKNFKTSTT